MSFASTPLGQGRRLDQKTFFAKPGQAPPPQAQSQQQTRNLKPTSRGSDVASSTAADPLRPDRWAVKDTSVQLANLIKASATSTSGPSTTTTTSHAAEMGSNPTSSWASMPATTAINRSTSVEYENQAHTAGLRRLGSKPVSRTTTNGSLTIPGAGPQRRTAQRFDSRATIPESEEEETRPAMVRGKSPLAGAMSSVGQAVSTVVNEVGFIMRARSREPEAPQKPAGVPEDSYDYSQEEREIQQSQATAAGPSAARRAAAQNQRKNKMSMDNKAYMPSDLDDSDEDSGSDGGNRKRRRKKKKGEVGGPLNSLPVLQADKRRKKRKGKKGGAEGEEESEEESREEMSLPPVAAPSSYKSSAPPSRSQPPLSRSSTVTRITAPTGFDLSGPDRTIDLTNAEEGSLNPIIEESEEGLIPPRSEIRLPTPQPSMRNVTSNNKPKSKSQVPAPAPNGMHPRPKKVPPPVSLRSPGVLLGRLLAAIGTLLKAIFSTFLHVLALALKEFGRVIGSISSVPKRLFGPSSDVLPTIMRTLIVLGGVYAVYSLLSSPLSRLHIGLKPAPSGVFTPPTAPAADVSELSDRLHRLESVLSSLTLDNAKERTRADKESEKREELQNKLALLERSLRDETRRAQEAEERARTAERSGLGDVKREIDSLRTSIVNMPKQTVPTGPVSDVEARNRLKSLEDKLSAVEDEAKEALELSKDAVKAGSKPSGSWWSKLTSTGQGTLTIKAGDGTDVTALIGRLVDGAVTRFHRDDLARPDFALHSGGANVIPSLTSDTYALRPAGAQARFVGLLTGQGYAMGRPPVTALHHELHLGHCWPFAGTEGQLGIKLATPVIIDAITVDHVAKEVAFDMRTAPREMEMWGLVEGAENVRQAQAYYAQRDAVREERRQAAQEAGEEFVDLDEEVYPYTLPREAKYMRIASFAYDVHAHKNVQTFEVPEEVKALGIDFGVVALVVKSNWGMEDFTCVYRVRVHGTRLVQPEGPMPPRLDADV